CLSSLPSLPLFFFFFLLIPSSLLSTLFPYTTLFRSVSGLTPLISTWSSALILKPLSTSSLHKLTFAVVSDSIGTFCFLATKFSADRKSTRLNSSHVSISYAVFCLKKKNKYLSSFLSI